MLTCRTCGMELHEDQKVCIRCGARTIRGDGFDYTVQRWRPSRRMIIAAGVVLFALLVLMVANALRITPPGEVARKWFEAMYGRDMPVASRMVTPNYLKFNEDRGMDLRSLSDELNCEVIGSSAKPRYGKAVTSGGKNATVQITLAYPDGQFRVVTIDLIKQGRRWMVDASR